MWEVSLACFLSGCWSFSPCFLGALNRLGKLDLWDQEAPKVTPSCHFSFDFLAGSVWGEGMEKFVLSKESHLFMFSFMASGFHT